MKEIISLDTSNFFFPEVMTISLLNFGAIEYLSRNIIEDLKDDMKLSQVTWEEAINRHVTLKKNLLKASKEDEIYKAFISSKGSKTPLLTMPGFYDNEHKIFRYFFNPNSRLPSDLNNINYLKKNNNR